MILAPQTYLLNDAGNTSVQKSLLGLGGGLHAEIDDIFELSNRDHGRATMIDRLYRRIEALVGLHICEANNAAVMDDSMAEVVAHRPQGLPTEDIDNVLGQANEKAAAMYFIVGASDDFMNST